VAKYSPTVSPIRPVSVSYASSIDACCGSRKQQWSHIAPPRRTGQLSRPPRVDRRATDAGPVLATTAPTGRDHRAGQTRAGHRRRVTTKLPPATGPDARGGSDRPVPLVVVRVGVGPRAASPTGTTSPPVGVSVGPHRTAQRPTSVLSGPSSLEMSLSYGHSPPVSRRTRVVPARVSARNRRRSLGAWLHASPWPCVRFSAPTERRGRRDGAFPVPGLGRDTRRTSLGAESPGTTAVHESRGITWRTQWRPNAARAGCSLPG
jgi:hypothetical protein